MTTNRRPRITPHQQTQIRLAAMKAHYLYLASQWRRGSEELVKAADMFEWLPSRAELEEHEQKLFDLFFDHYNRVAGQVEE